jgi:CubicO group peptidase (beta-lactamase class C family)
MRPKSRNWHSLGSFATAALSLAILALAASSFGAPRPQSQSQPPSAAAGVKPIEAQVDALFAPWNTLDSPGAAVAVVKDGLVVYRRGFGSAQLEYGIPITPSTVFHVASVSKQFTALAISMLEAAGKLSADDDIRKYLPEMADFGTPITIRHLLNHTSGLRDQWELSVMSGKRMDDVLTQDFLLDRIFRQKELNFAPGARFLYSNSGFTLLAEIVTRVSGKPFTDWTRDNIFRPLGMTSTHFHLDHTEIVRDRAYSYVGDLKEGFQNAPLNYANVGATSLFTTVEDMVNWIRNYEDRKVGGPAVWDKMLTKGVLANGTEIGYARGIMHGAYRGLKTIGHSGGDAGFASHVVYFPGQKFGVAVFSNLGSFNPGAMALRIADIYLAPQLAAAAPAPAVESQAPPAAAGPAPQPITLSPETLKAYAGTYWLDSNLLRRLVVDKDKLVYVRSSDNKSDLVPLSPTRFKMLGVPGDVYLDFAAMAGGLYGGFVFTESNGAKIKAKRIEAFEPNEAQLKEYTGTFYSEELDVRYAIAARAGSLVVRPGVGEEAEAGPMKKDVFAAGRFMIEFDRDGKGRVSGFRISTGRVLNLKFVRAAR